LVNIAIAAASCGFTYRSWFAEKYREAIWVGIIKTELSDAHRIQPTLDFFRRMLPSSLWMIPIRDRAAGRSSALRRSIWISPSFSIFYTAAIWLEKSTR
jgi:hypothetical protein